MVATHNCSPPLDDINSKRMDMEGHLRARQRNPSLIPSNVPRAARRRGGLLARPAHEPDFLEFVKALGWLVVAPVTIPYNIFYKTITSPLTVSLVLKAVLMGFLILASGTFSILAVGAFWWSWRAGGVVQTDGWLIYGSKINRTPHTLIPIVPTDFHEDLKYDVEIEIELVRPPRGHEEMGNFMLNLELRSLKVPEISLVSASQPSLPPPPLSYSLIPRIPLSLPSIPCLLPFPLRFLCSDTSSSRKAYRTRSGKDVVRVRKQMVDGVVLRPHRSADKAIGGVFVSVGREDSFSDDTTKFAGQPKEIRTTGWVVVRFSPRPSGIRWLLTSHPLPPLLLLPPISLTITLTSSMFAFLLISYLMRSSKSQEAVTDEDAFARKDREDEAESRKRQSEWQAVAASSDIAAGLGENLPEQRKMGSRAPSSTIGGSETTAPTVRSFGPIPEDTETEDGTEITQTATETDPGFASDSRADE